MDELTHVFLSMGVTEVKYNKTVGDDESITFEFKGKAYIIWAMNGNTGCASLHCDVSEVDNKGE